MEGLHYLTGKPVRIACDGGTITQVEEWQVSEEEQLTKLPWIGPGLVDLQINGYAGIDFNAIAVTIEDIHALTRKLWSVGTTSYYPTVITNSDETIEKLVGTIAKASATDRMTELSIKGIHLEGPFISPEDGPRGAHGQVFVKAPDWSLFERWQRAANGLIKIITLSPEWEEAAEFTTQCVRNGVKVSIGHTNATSEQIQKVVQAGATLSTHLGNGAHLKLPRHPNYLWDQLAQDELSPCVIADGFHLPANVLKVFLKVKPDQLMLVSDAVYLSGLQPGAYETHIGGRVVLTKEGRLHLEENPGLLAGSAQMLPWGIAHLVRSGICSLDSAWGMASVRPSAFMGLPSSQGLAVGAPADLVTFFWNKQEQGISIEHVYKNGEQVVSSNGL